jgi:hypothetical protein
MSMSARSGAGRLRRLVVTAVLAAATSVTLVTAVGGAAAEAAPLAPTITHAVASVRPAISGSGGNLVWYNVQTHLVLNITGPSKSNGATVDEYTYNTKSPSQYWYGNNFGSGMNFKFQNQWSGLCMDVVGPSNGNGAGVDQWNCAASQYSDYQVWKLITLTYYNEVDPQGQLVDTPIYELQNYVSGECLDVRDYNQNPNALLQQYPCSGSWNQQFYVFQA